MKIAKCLLHLQEETVWYMRYIRLALCFCSNVIRIYCFIHIRRIKTATYVSYLFSRTFSFFIFCNKFRIMSSSNFLLLQYATSRHLLVSELNVWSNLLSLAYEEWFLYFWNYLYGLVSKLFVTEEVSKALLYIYN